MIIFVTVIHVFVCLLLIAVILLQAGRGQGLGATFSGGEGTQSIFGTRSADFLSKATSVCAILFLFTCVGLNVLQAQKSRSLFDTRAPLKTEDLNALREALEKIEKESPAQSAASPIASESSPTERATSEPQGNAATTPSERPSDTASTSTTSEPAPAETPKPVQT